MWRALLADRAAGAARGLMAARFHRGLAVAIREAASALATQHGARAVALGGGVFQNATLLEGLATDWPLALLTACEVPAGDGGLALGQAVVAMARLLDAAA
jgi:hydrogenase maturation protein HypF